MAFTERDLEAQQRQIQDLEEELSRMNAQFEVQLKALNVSEAELKNLDQENIPAEVRQLLDEACAKAKREGQARAAQVAPSATETTGKAPGAGRRGVVRL